jgi:hypothetical protein
MVSESAGSISVYLTETSWQGACDEAKWLTSWQTGGRERKKNLGTRYTLQSYTSNDLLYPTKPHFLLFITFQ